MLTNPFKKFPINVMIFKRFGNVIKPTFDKSRYERVRMKTLDGIIETNYLILKKEKQKIPAPEISFYYDIEDKRWLYLLQIDRYTYYPMSFEGGKMTVNIPVYLYATDKNGKVVTDENGKPKIVMDEKGKPKMKFVTKVLFDSSLVLDNGQVIQLPNPIAHRTYDKEHWLSSEIETASRLYRSKDFWERYGNFVMIAVAGIIMVMFFYVGASQYNEMTKIVVNGLKELKDAMMFLADKLTIATQQVTGQPVAPPPIHPPV